MRYQPKRSRRNESGQATVEMVLVVLFLAVLMFAVVDFCRAIMTRQVMVNVSREGANLAARGTSFSNALDAVVGSAQPLDINRNGYVILTAVFRDGDGNAIITNQLAKGGLPTTSHIGSGIGSSPVLPNNQIPTTNQILVAAEVFYQYEPVTPIGKLLGIAPSQRLYDAAYF